MTVIQFQFRWKILIASKLANISFWNFSWLEHTKQYDHLKHMVAKQTTYFQFVRKLTKLMISPEHIRCHGSSCKTWTFSSCCEKYLAKYVWYIWHLLMLGTLVISAGLCEPAVIFPCRNQMEINKRMCSKEIFKIGAQITGITLHWGKSESVNLHQQLSRGIEARHSSDVLHYAGCSLAWTICCQHHAHTAMSYICNHLGCSVLTFYGPYISLITCTDTFSKDHSFH